MNLEQQQYFEEIGYFDEKSKSTRKKKPVKTQQPDKFDHLNIKDVKPLTYAQRQFFESFDSGYNIVADGAAGTGKTWVATYLALKELFSKKTNRIIFVRSAVNIRSQGFLPGTLDEKELVYTVPYKTIVNELCENGNAWDILTKKEYIKFMTTTYIRGITLNDCVVIVDEFQNADEGEVSSILTRIGNNSRIILCGDTRQNDLNRKREQSCHPWLLNLTAKLPDYFDKVHFTTNDVVRSGFCKAVIQAMEEM